MLIDSHCHLNYPGLVEREEEVLTSARARGVSGFLNISTRQREWAEVVVATERHPDVWASIGVHPHEAELGDHRVEVSQGGVAADGDGDGLTEDLLGVERSLLVTGELLARDHVGTVGPVAEFDMDRVNHLGRPARR